MGVTSFYWCFFAICAFLLISVAGHSSDDSVVSLITKDKCPENEICDSEHNPNIGDNIYNSSGTSAVKAEVPCQETDEKNGNCREIAKCDDGPCEEEKMQKMQGSPRKLKKARSKTGLHIALILKKKKQLMKPFMKPKPPPHHGHHDHHEHHHTTEPEPEEEEAPDPDDAPEDAPEIRLFNDEICVSGNCSNSTATSETPARAQKERPRKENPANQPDPSEANVRKRVIRFLKVLRMRRRLNPFFGRIRQRNASTISPEEKMRK